MSFLGKRKFTRTGTEIAPSDWNKRTRTVAPSYHPYARRTYARRPVGAIPELKFLDTNHSFTVDTTGEVPVTGQLNIIPQGIEESQRVGRKVTIKQIHMRLQVQPNTPAYVGSNVRLLLVQDKQANGAAATYSGAGGVLEADTPVAFRNLENSQRFTILKDWFFPITPTAGVAGAFNQVMTILTYDNNKLNIPIEFDSTAATGALTTIRSNNLFLLARSQADDDIYNVSGVTRIRYVDV